LRGAWRVLAYTFAAIPLGFLALMAMIAPGFLGPLGDDRASIAGFPMGYVLIAFVVVLTVIGVLTVRFVRQPVVVGVVLTLTIVLGLTVVFLAPAFVLIVINLKP
jgi:hypothetical protein